MSSPFIPQAFGTAPSPYASLGAYGAPALGSGAFGSNIDPTAVNVNSVNPLSAIPNLEALTMPTAVTGAGTAAAGGGMFDGLGDLFSGFSSTKNADGTTTGGWGGTALGIGQGLLSAYMGMKQYGIAKDTLNEGKRQFGLNYDAQKTTTNSALEDRQRARVASNPGAYQSVGDYMTANGIK